MTNEEHLDKKVAVVAGAGSGLGRATALKLAGAGWRVVGVDRSEEGLKALPEEIAKEVADSTNPQSAANVIGKIADSVGRIDALVNTVGTFALADSLSTTPDMWRLMFDVNLGPALWLSQAVTPHMQKIGSGAIVHIVSRPGVEPSAGMAGYAVSKSALVYLTRVLDLELRPLGIRVNAVAPQLINTERNRAEIPAKALVHAVEPEAIADVIAFLVSDSAAPISGAIVPVYGG